MNTYPILRFGCLAAVAYTPLCLGADDPDFPSPFQTVENTRASVAEDGVAEDNVPTLHFADAPKNSDSVGKSRTHYPEGVIDPAGQRRLSSSLTGASIRLTDGTPAGRIADLVVGANGVIEFLVVEWNELTYLLPYDVDTSNRNHREWRLKLNADDLRQTAAFPGLRADLDEVAYRTRLASAITQAEAVWGLAKTTREWSTLKPISPVQATRSGFSPSAADGSAAAPGLPILAQPQAVAVPGRTQTLIVQPTPNAEAGTPQPPATETVVIPFGGVAPVVGNRNPAALQNPAGMQPIGNRSLQNGTGAIPNGTGVFAPTSPSNSQFPNANNSTRTTPSGTPVPATIGGPNPPRFTSAGGGNTIGGPTPQPITPRGTGTQSRPAQTTVPGLSTPPPAGTATTPSPNGTRYPTRIP